MIEKYINNYIWRFMVLLCFCETRELLESVVNVKVVEPQAFCKFNPNQDLDTKYCGLWGNLDIPLYPNDIEQISLKTSLYYTSIVDL